MNQLAGVRQMCFALRYLITIDANALVCTAHPSQSSAQAAHGATDHDLIVNAGSDVWHIEVSDVSGSRDGNDKYLKDMATLGVTAALAGERDWPATRVAVAVAAEHGRWILSYKPRKQARKARRQVVARCEHSAVIEFLEPSATASSSSLPLPTDLCARCARIT